MKGEDVRSTSSSSPSTTALLEQIQKSMMSESRAGQTSTPQPLPITQPAQNNNVADTTSCSPTPTPVRRANPHVSNASDHTSSSKRRRSSPPLRKTTPTSSCKVQADVTSDSIHELVEFGKKRLNIAERMLQRELDARPKVHSLEECMARINDVPRLSLEAILSACEALKDERNRTIFMSLRVRLVCTMKDY